MLAAQQTPHQPRYPAAHALLLTVGDCRLAATCPTCPRPPALSPTHPLQGEPQQVPGFRAQPLCPLGPGPCKAAGPVSRRRPRASRIANFPPPSPRGGQCGVCTSAAPSTGQAGRRPGGADQTGAPVSSAPELWARLFPARLCLHRSLSSDTLPASTQPRASALAQLLPTPCARTPSPRPHQGSPGPRGGGRAE